jgi:hypothetical protein
MNWQLLITLLAFGGGPLFYLLNIVFFENRFKTNIGHILNFIIALIPGFGTIIAFAYFVECVCKYERYPLYTNDDGIYIRDTKLNRWLFNDVRWYVLDHHRAYEKEKEMQKQNEDQK